LNKIIPTKLGSKLKIISRELNFENSSHSHVYNHLTNMYKIRKDKNNFIVTVITQWSHSTFTTNSYQKKLLN